MTLNTIFLGHNSVVDIKTKETIEGIKLKLASRYNTDRYDPKNRFPGDSNDFSTKYVYYLKKNELKIYFSKDLNRKIRHDYQGTYPWFVGHIFENGDSRLIKGKIGLPEWRYYFILFWFAFFTLVYINWTIKEESDFWKGEIAIYFLLFGLISLFFGLVHLRKKVSEMRDELDRVF